MVALDNMPSPDSLTTALDDPDLAVSGSRAVCSVELARFPRGRCVVRCIGAPIFGVLNESAQLRRHVASVRIVQKNPRCCDGEGRKQRLQLAISDRRFGERTGQLRKS